MTIEFVNVVPVYLEKEKVERSKIWNNHVVFSKGDRVQVIAPSGSGKTSFIHFMYGMRRDYNGKITFNGKNIQQCSMNDFAAYRSKEISVIFQDLRLFPDHSVMENIEIKRKLNPNHNKSRITEMAARLGIEKKLDKLARTCSYGEQQRIAIIRALQQPFEIILMDEPFSHLDENNRGIAMELINEEAAKRGAGIIMADLKRVEQFATDKVIHL